jgi:hypothetical protein
MKTASVIVFRFNNQREEEVTRRIESPVILINHWRWLEANGYKQEASSCKRQAASLTRKSFNVIGKYRRKKYENR